MSTTGGSDRGGSDEFDGPTAAFRRLLKDVASDERARVDALVVLAQRTVYVATWPTDPDSGIRTLRSSSGDTAMPIFSSQQALQDAAQRYGWLNPDGSLSFRELGAREALRRAIARGVQFVVIDIGLDHSVEFARSEVEPLISGGRKDSTGPFAVSNKVSTALMDAVRKTSRPPPPDTADVSSERAKGKAPDAAALKPAGVPKTDDALRPGAKRSATPFPPERYASAPPPRPAASNAPGPHAAQASNVQGTPASRKRSMTPDPARLTGPLVDPSGMTFRAPLPLPSDDSLDQIADALRRFPEVEWAAVVTAIKDTRGQLMIVLRVDPAYRTRLADLNRRARLAAEDAGVPMGVTVIDDVLQMKSARSTGLVFFPWKKKAKSS